MLPISATITLLGMIACTKNNPSVYVMTTPVMHDTRPWCIGRFALDLPSDIAVYNQQFPTTGPDGRQATLSDDFAYATVHSPRLIASQVSSFIDL